MMYIFCFFIFFVLSFFFFFFFFNDTATTEIYTLSLHDALPICDVVVVHGDVRDAGHLYGLPTVGLADVAADDVVVQFGGVAQVVLGDEALARSEEHTSELQSLAYLVCRLLLEKKKKKKK